MIEPGCNDKCCVTSASKTGVCRYSIVKALEQTRVGELLGEVLDALCRSSLYASQASASQISIRSPLPVIATSLSSDA